MSAPDIAAALNAVATEAGGIAAIRFISGDQLPALIANARAGDDEAAHTLGLLNHLLNGLDERGGALRCFWCGKPVRRFPTAVLVTAESILPRSGLGGVIGSCCDQPEPELYMRVIAVLNASIEGGTFQPWQGHAPGHA
jgi:hypothetical protein